MNWFARQPCLAPARANRLRWRRLRGGGPGQHLRRVRQRHAGDALETAHGDRIEFGFPDSYEITFGIEKAVAAAIQEAPQPPSTSSGLAKLRATLEVARALESSLSTNEVLAAVVDAALTITSCERGFLLLRKGDDLEIRVGRSKGGPLAPGELQVPTRLLLRALDSAKIFCR